MSRRETILCERGISKGEWMEKENGESESEERKRDQKMGLFPMSVFNG